MEMVSIVRWAIYLGYLTLLIAIGGVCYGVWSICEQQRKITSFEPVDAVVLSQRLGETKAGNFVLSIPVVEYEYTVDGRKYVTATVACFHHGG